MFDRTNLNELGAPSVHEFEAFVQRLHRRETIDGLVRQCLYEAIFEIDGNAPSKISKEILLHCRCGSSFEETLLVQCYACQVKSSLSDFLVLHPVRIAVATCVVCDDRRFVSAVFLFRMRSAVRRESVDLSEDERENSVGRWVLGVDPGRRSDRSNQRDLPPPRPIERNFLCRTTSARRTSSRLLLPAARGNFRGENVATEIFAERTDSMFVSAGRSGARDVRSAVFRFGSDSLRQRSTDRRIPGRRIVRLRISIGQIR